MLRLPKAAEPLVSAFSVAFTRPTFQRVLVLFLGAVLSLRHRTITGMLRAVGPLAKGHWSDFHRVLSCRVWSAWPLAKVLAAMTLELIPTDQPVVCPVDDTTQQHKGKHVYGNEWHRDACRSTHRHLAQVSGHKWVMLAINVTFPFASRPWALPVLCALYRLPGANTQNRRHKTPTDLARQLMATLIHWFPRRKFILVGDGGFASHGLSRFCHRHGRHCTLVSRFHSDANLYELPEKEHSPRRGRPRIKGRKLPKAQEVVEVAKAKGKRFTVNWYGGQTRQVELIWGEGHWYKVNEGMTPVRWVFIHDAQGTHRDEYVYSTDPTLPPDQIVSLFTARWNIEVTFQEVRAHLGLATPRNWSAKSVLRTTPCLLGLFSLVSLIFHRHTRGRAIRPATDAWYAKPEPTFSDAIACVRRLCWSEILQQPQWHGGVEKFPRQLCLTLLDHLSRAA
jgi:DDE superfamily endonuclease